MTSNQIAHARNNEEARANRAKEALESRNISTRERANELKGAEIAAKTATSLIDTAAKAGMLKGAATAFNDPKWYTLDPQLVKDTASISFNVPLGNPQLNLSNGDKSSFPGIMAIEWVPTIGASDTESNVANIAAKNIYAFVRHANSGKTNYEASDLMMYLYAVDQAISFWAHMRRIYSLGLDCKGYDKYYNSAYLEALGMRADDVKSNLADIRSAINALAVRLNAFFIPKNLPFIARHVWLNSTIWKDSPIKKSQNYMFVQRFFGHFSDNPLTQIKFKTSAGAKAKDYSFGQKLYASDLISEADDIINSLMTSEDFGIMSGDILKAYGESEMYLVPTTYEDYHIEAAYSEEVLSQITNTIPYGMHANDSIDITQDATTGIITQGMPYFKTDGTAVQGKAFLMRSPTSPMASKVNLRYYILNFYKDNPSPEEVIVSTRLTPTFSEGWFKPLAAADAPVCWKITSMGTELCTHVRIVYLNADGIAEASYFQYLNHISSTSGITFAKTMKDLQLLTKFDWAPVVYFLNDATGDTSVCIDNRDVANYATVFWPSLINMHYTAVMSEYGVPLLGGKVRLGR